MASDKPARPTGVTILAVLCAIAAPFSLLAALLVGVMAPFLILLGGSWGVLGAMMAPMLLVYAIACAAAAFGMFKGTRWGWYAGLGVLAIGAVLQVFSLVAGDLVSGVIGLAVSVAVAWYLSQPGVQAWFGLSIQLPWHGASAPA